MAKSVREAMTKDPRSVGASESVVEAARLMREEHIGSLPITDDEQLVGMITDRDITTRVVAEAADPKTTSIGDVYSRHAVGAQNAFAAAFHSRRRCAISCARSSSLPLSSTWRSEASARR